MDKTDFDKTIIIDRPKLVTKTRQFTEMSIAIACWILWFFLLRPLIILLVWFLGYMFAYRHMIELGGIENVRFFAYQVVVLLGIFSAIYTWNRYNVLRFRGRERRKFTGDATDKGMGDFFCVSKEEVEQLKNCRNVAISFYENRKVELESSGIDKITAKYDPQSVANPLTRKYIKGK